MWINKVKIIGPGLAIFLVFSVFLADLFRPAGISLADETETEEAAVSRYYNIRLDQPTIAKGYTVAAFDDALKLSLTPGILSEATAVEVIELNETLPMPWRLDRLSEVYQFEFQNKAAYADRLPFYIRFAYENDSPDYKQVFFYDKNYDTWRPLPTRDYPKEKFARSLIHLPFARIAVFSYPGVMASGRASWYAYKNGDFTASPDFPKGSRLRVHNPENGKFVDVVVNDYGPDRSRHPDRVVDLDKTAFAKLAGLGAGTIGVVVEPLSVARENDLVLGVPDGGVGLEPKLTAAAAIIMAESSGEILWEKNATATLPLASLTKLVAVKVFLDQETDLKAVAAYSLQDEKYNHEHCEPWESAKLALKEGETVTAEDLIYASLAGSANNTVETLVRLSGLGRAEFIGRMNEAVENRGASSTKFIEPSGLAPENVSSARDYAIITKWVLTHPLIVKASIAPEYRFTTLNTNRALRVRNTNNLVHQHKYPINGSKTGYLDEAGYCLMTRIGSPLNQGLIIVTFGAPTRSVSFMETEELIIYGTRLMRN